jgi:hypothetical protein
MNDNRVITYRQSGNNHQTDLDKINIVDYINYLKEKVKHNYHEINTKFTNADLDSKGGVSKEAFAHIIAAVLGPTRPFNNKLLPILLDKIGLKNKQIIRYKF